MKTDKRITKHNQYHYSITGNFFRVNFYPTKNTFYINGCNKSMDNKYDNLQFIIDLADGKVEIKKPLSEKKSKYKYKPNTRKKLFQESNKCFVCGKEILDYSDASLEHKIPLSKGGSNRKDNLSISCKECNIKRGSSIKII